MPVGRKARRSSASPVSRCLFLLAAFCAAALAGRSADAQSWTIARRSPDPTDPSQPAFEALNPDHNLRAFFAASGARFFPFKVGQPVWWLDMAPLSAGPEGAAAPWPQAAPRSAGD